MYPRVIRLGHSGSYNNRIIVSVTTFGQGAGLGAIFESRNEGKAFSRIGTVTDPAGATGKGLCCSTLLELPAKMGANPAGTLLWAASMGAQEPNRRMALRVWRSLDHGRTWSYLSSCATTPNTGGLWEPELSVDSAKQLVCHYSDETEPKKHSQSLRRVVSTDGGVSWHRPVYTVTGQSAQDRPGMAVVRRVGAGGYLMSYEICGRPGPYDCAARLRTSPDGWNWGRAADDGTLIRTRDGSYLRHAPTIAWANGGRIFMVGQQLFTKAGVISPVSGNVILVNSHGGVGAWDPIAAPVPVGPTSGPEVCANYSSALLPSADGTSLLEVASRIGQGGGCQAYFATTRV
jgi:hypothetical protein